MASASQIGEVCRKWVKCVASGSSASASSASQVGQVRRKWVRCVASGASGSKRLINGDFGLLKGVVLELNQA